MQHSISDDDDDLTDSVRVATVDLLCRRLSHQAVWAINPLEVKKDCGVWWLVLIRFGAVTVPC